MANERLFRWFFVAIFASILTISGYFRYRARQSGEAIPRRGEGTLVMLTRVLFAAPLYLPILAYMLNPAWVTAKNLSPLSINESSFIHVAAQQSVHRTGLPPCENLRVLRRFVP